MGQAKETNKQNVVNKSEVNVSLSLVLFSLFMMYQTKIYPFI